MLTSWGPHLVFSLCLGALFALELRDPGFRAASFGRDRARRRRNHAFLAAAIGVAVLLRGVEPVLRAALGRGPWAPDGVWGGALEIGACFLLAELVGWALHFAKHRGAYLWRFHFQHHQETRFDVWMVTHTHGLETLVSGTILLALLVSAGFSERAVEAYVLFYALANTWQHSSRHLSLGPLDQLVISPAYHRRHHEVTERGETAVNFGITLTVWDRVFGTARFPARRGPADAPVGIPAGPEPYGFWREMTWFLAPPDVDPEPELRRPLPRGASGA
jgi:sterol desaturase/sphingolipid hydroxylase (fatty acid hydroxylase superfamily)